MGETQHSSRAKPLTHSDFWDALAPHHSAIEDHYLDVPTIRRIMKDLQRPVLIVGAGQGLIVEEIRKGGIQCDGVDLSSEMIRYAKLRRGITLIHADAKAVPVAGRSYGTVIYATGVIDFTEDEAGIRLMLEEGKRIIKEEGKIYVAFYRISAALESFSERVGLLNHNTMVLGPIFELCLLNPGQMITWVANKTGLSRFRAALLLLQITAGSTRQEIGMTFRMQKIFHRMKDPQLLINAAPKTEPYRNENEIRRLFERLAIPIKQLGIFTSCFMVRIQ